MSAAAILSGLTLGAHLATAHIAAPDGSNLRSDTPGLYLRDKSGLTLGVYRNSYGDASAYAGWTWQTEDERFALTAGGVTGYPGAPVYPLLVPSVRFGVACKGCAVRLAYIPKPPRYGSAAGVHLSIERSFQ